MFDAGVQTEPLDPEQEQRAVRLADAGAGAVVSFVGVLRDWNQNEPVREMFLEHYPGMTDKVLRELVEQARARWPLRAVRVRHRVGRLLPEDPIVVVVVASVHRAEAFRACEFLIDALKTRAPLWKREKTAGGERWLAARDQDTEAARRWDGPSSSSDGFSER